MTVKNKSLIILAIILTATLACTMSPATASTDTAINVARKVRAKPLLTAQVMPQLQKNLEELDEAEIEGRLNEAIDAPATDDSDSKTAPLWIARLHGKAWPIPATEPSPSVERIGVIFAATKIKTTEYGSVYDIVWGIIGHDGERIGVKGKGVLCSDGVFVIKLEGDDLEFYGIGLVGKAMYGVRLAMKGYMEHDGVMHSYNMAGGAYPIGFNMKRLQAN